MEFGRAGRVFWPEDGTRFAAIGGFVGLASDFASFLGNLGSPKWLFWPALLGVALLLVVCWRRVFDTRATDTPDKLKAAIDCTPCTVFRVLLFACIGIGLLLVAGQGATATERLGTQLGLIQQDVTVVKQDTMAIREDVGAMRAMGAANALVDNPSTAEDWFHNAWVHTNIRNDTASAWKHLQVLYERFAPNKLDAAELYLNVGKNSLPRDALLAQMVDIGRKRKDAAMLVIAGRNADTDEAAFTLYDEARAIDADMPFAYWDLGRTQLLMWSANQPTFTLGGRAPYMRQEMERLEEFLSVAGRKPVARYFFQPRYQADYEQVARQHLETLRKYAGQLERTDAQQAAAMQRMNALANGGAQAAARAAFESRKGGAASPTTASAGRQAASQAEGESK